VKLECTDFESLVRSTVKKGDFVYLDPPYAVANKKIFLQYGPDTFGIYDIDRLEALLNYINNKQAHFVMSYAYSVEIEAIFSKWKVSVEHVQRNISGFSKNRKIDSEIIVTNILDQL
jgi:DNA adenine methylase